MKHTEKMIRIQIEALTLDRIAPRKQKIEDAIEFMYMQGTFSKRKYDKMRSLLSVKYTEIMNKYHDDLKKSSDRDFEAMMKHYYSDNYT